MALETLKRLTSGPKPVALTILLLLTSLYLMSAATQNSELFGKLYSLLLAINVLAILLLLSLITRNLIHLVSQYRRRTPGSRLTTKLVLTFVILSVTPISVLYYFSMQFLHRGIDSWFDLRVEQALDNALELGRTALNVRERELLRQTRQMAVEISGRNDEAAPLLLADLIERNGASELTLLSASGQIIANESASAHFLFPSLPRQSTLLQLRHGVDYIALEPIAELGLAVRGVVNIPGAPPASEGYLLQAIYPIPEQMDTLAESVQQSYAKYQELSYLRQPLKTSFLLTLSLVLLLSLLAAVWSAFFSARRLVAPIRKLAEGTQAVAAGDFNTRLTNPGSDELGFLVTSFNDMTRRLARARDETRHSQAQLEAQHAYLEAVLDQLSSGVFTVDAHGRLRIANRAAAQILGSPLDDHLGHPLAEMEQARPATAPLIETIEQQRRDAPQWQAEVTLFGPTGRQILLCRASTLHYEGALPDEYLIVFDDITDLIQVQRDAAWGEVARRLAHEIKNPLTPIQLSAERLRHKYLEQMAPEDAEVLDRATHTIVQQVEAMKGMVKAFSDYARPPKLSPESVRLDTLINEVVELYRGDSSLSIELRLTTPIPYIHADTGRLRQLLHNLIRNAIEAGDEQGRAPHLIIATRCDEKAGCRYVQLSFRDNGPGIPEELLSTLFDPYTTTKLRGSGLGLAIVKKIVEEHGGIIWAHNCAEGGAEFTLRLPVQPNRCEQQESRAERPAAEG